MEAQTETTGGILLISWGKKNQTQDSHRAMSTVMEIIYFSILEFEADIF